MNSLNLLTARVIGNSSSEKPPSKRTRSYSEGNLNSFNAEEKPKRSASQRIKRVTPPEDYEEDGAESDEKNGAADSDVMGEATEMYDEKIPLLGPSKPYASSSTQHGRLRKVVKRLVDALTASLRWALSALAAPCAYLMAGFHNDDDRFSAFAPLRKLSRISFRANGTTSTSQAVGLSRSSADTRTLSRQKQNSRDSKRRSRQQSSKSDPSSDRELLGNQKPTIFDWQSKSRPKLHTSSSSSEDVPQTRRSVRIKSYNEDTTRRRKQNRDKARPSQDPGFHELDSAANLTVADIKSPTSPAASLHLTNHQYMPTPPRPLIPARQPSYSIQTPPNSRFSQKTLVIDLDETLIHSLAKGGRMSSGHMVEVKLNTTVGIGGATLGPHHPILYYVHKRPHCDDFLRRVSKWYNLVVFTASVQEYADPVIDWLEQERRYFSGRFYRQHCTFRNGAYIKDLSSVEPDLSKVMILDNSPLSYIFHEGKILPQSLFRKSSVTRPDPT